MAAVHISFLFFIILFYSRVHVIISLTDQGDGEALQALKNSWKNTPPSWNQSNDPCGLPWEGVTCNSDSRVIELKLRSTSLKGTLGAVIGGLTALKALDLPYNNDLTGPLPRQLGNLINLNSLVLNNCGFTGSIPDELGNLTQLINLYLYGNKLSGKIPPSLGKLSKLNWVDLSHNQLSGQLPVSIGKTPGLDLLLKVKGLLFEDNKLSGFIPSKLFSPNMALKCLYLKRNALSGEIPSTISNLTNLRRLDLSQNRLAGALPDLSKMASLHRLCLSNNFFEAAEAPSWFSTLPSLAYLYMEYGSLQGSVPTKLFSLPSIRNVRLRNNVFNGTLTISGTSIGSRLRNLDLQNNQISSVTFDSNFTTLILAGNPICKKALSNTNYCHPGHIGHA